MGQYWAYANKTKKLTFLQNSGLKMMEHSYTGNINAGILYFLLANKKLQQDLKGIKLSYEYDDGSLGKKVSKSKIEAGSWLGDKICHVGDYSDDMTEIARGELVKTYSLPVISFDFKKGTKNITEDEFCSIMDDLISKNAYVYCADKKEYFNLTKLLFVNAVIETKDEKNSYYIPGHWFMAVDSLTLLLSPQEDVGQGGGDYYDRYPNHGQTGRWFNQSIELTNEEPSPDLATDITEQIYFTESYLEDPTEQKDIDKKNDFIKNQKILFNIYDTIKDKVIDSESFKKEVIFTKTYFSPQIDGLKSYLMKLKTNNVKSVDINQLFKRDLGLTPTSSR
jgi:hypothetical protein